MPEDETPKDPMQITRTNKTVESLMREHVDRGHVLVLALFASEDEFDVEMSADAVELIPALIEHLNEISRKLAH